MTLRTTSAALALALVASLVACTGEGGSESATSGATTSTSTSTSKGDTEAGTSASTTTSGGEESLTEPGTEGTTDGSTGDETGCSFVECLDGGGNPNIECDLWAQDCPDGEKCTSWAADGGSSWNATKCVPVDPNPVQPGEVCNTGGTGGVSGQDNCDKGSMCWNVDYETDEGTCIALCEGSEMNPSCAPGFSCSIPGSGFPALCFPMCDPLLQDCPGGDLCLPIHDRWICILDASGGEGTYGVPCEFANACNPGLLCMNAEYVEDCKGPGCCTPYCDIFEPNTCPGATQECIPWYEEMPLPTYEHIGFCGIPQ